MLRRCAVLAVLLVSCAVLATSHSTPLFAWSGTNLLQSHPGRQSLSPFSLSDLSWCLASPTTGYHRTCNLYAADAARPELQLVFLTPELSLTSVAELSGAYSAHPNGGALVNLERLQEQSASAVAFPYASLGDDAGLVDSSLVALMRYDLAAGATSVVASDDASSFLAKQARNTCTLTELAAYLAARPELSSNGVTDLVVVVLRGGAADAIASDDAYMGSIVESVASATGGNYLAVFTGRTSSVPESLPARPAPHAVLRDDIWDELLGDSNSTCNRTRGECDNHGYWPPEVLAAVLGAAMLAAVLLGAIRMTADVQTPERFESPAKGQQMHKQ